MTGDVRFHDIALIRDLLLNAFSAEELPRFCQDRPTFQPIRANFGPGYNLNRMVDEVIAYCQDHDLFEMLLAEVKDANPRQYARFEPQLRISAEELAKIPCPYRGLEPFEAEHAGFYFGRQAMVEQLVAKIQYHDFVAVVGSSGCGKSSLVRAGLVTALRGRALLGSQDWQTRIFRPGADPLFSLCRQLIALLEPDETPGTQQVDAVRQAGALRDGTLSMSHIVADLRNTHPDISHLLLIVDQFEELYTECQDEASRLVFVKALLAAAEQKKMRIVLTLRADFYGHVLSDRALGQAVSAGLVNVLPMNEEELRAVIEQPALSVGRTFEPGLVKLILEDIVGEPGNLPLLEFALTELWGQQTMGGVLTHQTYEAIGQVEGAIARRAEAVYLELDKEGHGDTVRRVLLRLTHYGEGAEGTRRRAALGDLVTPRTPRQDVEAVITALVNARLVVTGQDDMPEELPEVRGEAATAEVSHEALIRGWGQLRTWLDEDRAFGLWRERLYATRCTWQETGHDEGALLRGAPLAEAKGWLADRGDDMNQAEREFLSASIAREDDEARARELAHEKQLKQARALAKAERSRVRTLGVALAVMAVLLIIASISAGLALYNRSLAITNAGVAATEAANAQQQLTTAEAAQAAAEFNGRIAWARELSARSLEALEWDPESGLLLAVASCNVTLETDGMCTAEGEAALDAALGSHFLGTLRGHTGRINSVAFSPDGSRLATTGWDSTAHIWDLSSRKVLAVLEAASPHKNELVEVATFSPDGERILTASYDGTARLWDAQDYSRIADLVGHTRAIQTAAFNFDGSCIVTASSDGTARLWDGKTGALLHTLVGHSGQIWSAAFSPDGRQVVTAGDDGTARLWRVSDGAPIDSIVPHPSGWRVGSLSFSPDGHIIALTADSVAYLWRVAEPMSLTSLEGHQDSVRSAVFSPDGRQLVTTSRDRTGRIWDVERGALVATLAGHTGSVVTADFSPDGDRIVTASNDGTARLWDSQRGALILNLRGHSYLVWDAQFSPDGREVATGSADMTARIWSIALEPDQVAVLAGQEQMIISSSEGPVAKFSPDSTKIISAGYDYKARLWAFDEVEGANLIGDLPDDGVVWDADFSPDGDRVVTACANAACWGRLWRSVDGSFIAALEGETNGLTSIKFSADGSRILGYGFNDSAWLYDGDSGRLITSLDAHEGWITAADISPDGQRIVTTGEDVTIRLWDAETGQLISTPPIAWTGLSTVFSPDSKLMAVLTRDNSTVSLRDGRSGEMIAELRGHTGDANSAVFSPDSAYLATVSDDTKLKLWDVATHTLIATFAGHRGPVNAVDFHPAGTLVVTGGEDNTVRIWDLERRRLVSTYSGHTDDVRSVRFSPDGRFVVSACEDGTVRVWRIVVNSIEEKMAIAAQRAARSFTPDECQQYFGSAECPAELLAVQEQPAASDVAPTSGGIAPTPSPLPPTATAPAESATPTPTPVPYTTTAVPAGATGTTTETLYSILWLEDCDPRTDPAFCGVSSSLQVLQQLYQIIDGLSAQLVYGLPSTYSDLEAYDLALADFCGPGANSATIGYLKDYVAAGGSVVVLGDEFCQGVGPIDGAWLSSGQAASLLTQEWGILFTDDDTEVGSPFSPFIDSPLTRNVDEIHSPRHAFLEVSEPAQKIVGTGDHTFIALFDGVGTVVAIPDVGFAWDKPSRNPPSGDNFLFWSNMLHWLIEQSQDKLQRTG